MKKQRFPFITMFSAMIALLIAVASIAGLFSPGLYINETANWRAQAIGQDYINLFVAAFLLITALPAVQESRSGIYIWGGVIAYLTYTYIIYCFAVHFNELFVVYCVTLGLCVYALGYFIRRISVMRPPHIHHRQLARFIGIYFIIVSFAFYYLWLSDILFATWSLTIPASIDAAQLPTNPVYVMDISVVLPGTLLAGIALLRRKALSGIMVPVVLTFLVLMDVTIAALTAMMNARHITQGDMLIYLMTGAALLNIFLLVAVTKNYRITRAAYRIKPGDIS